MPLEHFAFIRVPNCFVHSLHDQLLYDPLLSEMVKKMDNLKLRQAIVNSLEIMVLTNRLTWIEDENTGPRQDWAASMSTNGQFVDHFFVQLAAEYLNRVIILYPVVEEDGHSDTGKILISPQHPQVILNLCT